MGNTITVSLEPIKELTSEQLSDIHNGSISPLSLQIFLHNFLFVSKYRPFYTEMPLEKQLFVFEQIGILTKNECSTVIENYCLYSSKEDTLFQSLYQISRKLICKTHDKRTSTDVYLPIGLDKKLWKSIIQKKWKTSFGYFKIKKNMVDFSNPEIQSERERFINEMQDQIHEHPHSKEYTMIIQSNPVDNLWKKEINRENIPLKKETSKPMSWEMNIFKASFKGKLSSVEYIISLIPEMVHIIDENGNNLVHHAAYGNRSKMLVYLHGIGADFSLSNKRGFLPIHLIEKKRVIRTMNSLGININTRNADGENLLDIKTKNFDKSMIITLFGLGADIFEPNPKGPYWIQTALFKKYFGKMKKDEFIIFVRKQLISNKTATWNKNPIYNDIVNPKDKNPIEKYDKELKESVIQQDIPRIQVLLAIGANADKLINVENETNLLYCAKNGLTEIARILLNNYCSPNKTNNQKENAFWIAASNKHFKLAILLKKYGADKDALNKDGETLKHVVYRTNDTVVFQFLLKVGASPNVKNSDGKTVTFIAFQNRDDEVAEMLQDTYKGDINSLDGQKNSLAHLALKKKDLQRIEYLVNRGINMNLKDNKGRSVLMLSFLTEIDFETWDFLINHGSKINTTDNDNNTLLHHLLFQKNSREDVYNYLRNKNINYDVENKNGQFPISIAIEMCHDKIGFDLLNSNCNIINKTSIHEPIVEALKRGSSKWFEALVDHGANAMNEKFGVVSRYIRSGFFNFEVLKKIPSMNIFLDAPLQTAIYEKQQDCALFLWNRAKANKQESKLAKNLDCHKRIPLSAAIITGNETFVNILLQTYYDLETPDENGKTPFIYACIVNRESWMTKIFSHIPLSNANKIDNDDCSALTYAASNNKKDFCDALFINNIEVYKIKVDEYGIIEYYRNILSRYERAKSQAQRNLKDAESACNEMRNELSNLKRNLKKARENVSSCEREMNYMENSESVSETAYKNFIEGYHSSLREVNQLEKYIPKVEVALSCNEDAYRSYRNNYDYICDAKRKDVLTKISYYENRAIRDKKIQIIDRSNNSDCIIC